MSFDIFSSKYRYWLETLAGSHPLLINELTSGRMLASGATGRNLVLPVQWLLNLCMWL